MSNKPWTTENYKTLNGTNKSLINCMCNLNDGLFATSHVHDKVIKIWDLATMKETGTLVGHVGSIQSLSYNNGTLVSAAGSDENIFIWDVNTLKLSTTLKHQNAGSIFLLPNNLLIAGATVFDLKTMKEKTKISGASPCYIPELGYVATHTSNGITFLDLNYTSKVHFIDFTQKNIVSYCPLPHGFFAVSYGYGFVSVWDVVKMCEVTTVKADDHCISSLVSLPNGLLAGGCSKGVIKIWSVPDFQVIQTMMSNGYVDINGGGFGYQYDQLCLFNGCMLARKHDVGIWDLSSLTSMSILEQIQSLSTSLKRNLKVEFDEIDNNLKKWKKSTLIDKKLDQALLFKLQSSKNEMVEKKTKEFFNMKDAKKRSIKEDSIKILKNMHEKNSLFKELDEIIEKKILESVRNRMYTFDAIYEAIYKEWIEESFLFDKDSSESINKLIDDKLCQILVTPSHSVKSVDDKLLQWLKTDDCEISFHDFCDELTELKRMKEFSKVMLSPYETFLSFQNQIDELKSSNGPVDELIHEKVDFLMDVVEKMNPNLQIPLSFKKSLPPFVEHNK